MSEDGIKHRVRKEAIRWLEVGIFVGFMLPMALLLLVWLIAQYGG